MKSPRLQSAVLLLLILVVPVCGHAVWSGNPAVNSIVVNTDDQQLYPQINDDGSGGAVVVWKTGSGNLAAQRLDANGERLWPAEGVLIESVEGVQSFQTASDGSGGVVVAWHIVNDAGESDIYAQRVSASGDVMWASGGKAVSTAPSEQYYLSATGDGSGGIIVVWQDLRNSTRNEGIWDVYAQRISADGNDVWTSNGIPVGSSVKTQWNARVVLSGEQGGAIITWAGVHTDTQGLEHRHMRAQKINGATGLSEWGAAGRLFSTYKPGWYYDEPHMIRDGSGGAIVAWSVYEGSARRGISARRIDAAGAVMWPGNAVITGSDFFTYDSLRIVSDGSGGLVAAWIDYKNDTNVIPRIFAQRLDANGSALWAGGGVPLTANVSGRYLNSLWLIGDGTGGAIVTWDDDRSGAFDVFAQRLNADGVKQWASNGVAVSTALDDQALPRLVGDGSGGAIIAWMDNRDWFLGVDVYAQRLMSNGKLPAVLTVLKAGYGKGGVTADPGVLNWTGKTGLSTYTRGDSVTLTAAPTAGSAFGGWGGACSSYEMALVCTVNMTAEKKVRATFNPVLKVSKGGTGKGVVVSEGFGVEGDGIMCGNGGTNCLESYAGAPSITLTATAGTNSVFAGWTGACADFETAQCIVKMNAARNVKAYFDPL